MTGPFEEQAGDGAVEGRTPSFRVLAKIASTTLVIYVIYSGLMLAVVPCGSLGLVDLGRQFIHAEQAGIPEKCVPTPYGYDGQFYWAASLTLWTKLLRGHLHGDPRNSIVTYDVPATRLQRIGLPFLASITGFGRPGATATSMLVIELLAVTGIAIAGAFLFVSLGASPWYGLVPAFYPGLALSTGLLLTEPLALMALLTGLAFFFRRRWIPAGIAFTLAVLSRETTLLAVLVILATSIAYRGFTVPEKYRAAATCLVPGLFFTLWHLYVAYLTGYFPTEQSAVHNLSFPGSGLLSALERLWPPASAIDLFYLGFLIAAIGLIALLVTFNAQLYRADFVHKTMASIFFAYFFLMLFYSVAQYVNHTNLLRSIGEGVVTGLFGALIWLQGKKRLRAAFLACIATGWCVAAAYLVYNGSHRNLGETTAGALSLNTGFSRLEFLDHPV